MKNEIAKISTLLLAIIFSTTGYFGSLTVTVLVASEVMTNQLFVGLPMALAVGGSIIGTKIIGYLSQKFSMLQSLVGAYFIGSLGGVILFLSIIYDSTILLIFGALFLGVGQSATLQTRYFASFIVSSEFKTVALSFAVWVSAFGSIFGPNSVGLFSDFFAEIFNSALIVGYILAFTGMVTAGSILFFFTSKDSDLRKKNTVQTKKDVEQSGGSSNSLSSILIVNHVIMVLIMSATPLHLRDLGENISTIGTIISVHTLGMFFFAPFIGKFVDKVGIEIPAKIGSIIMLTSCLLTLASKSVLYLGFGLFLLGLGWNFTYIATSSAISSYSSKYSTDLNIRSDMYVFAGSASTQLLLGFSYFNLGYRIITSVGLVVSLWLILKTQKLKEITKSI